jgi:hypothetical protein
MSENLDRWLKETDLIIQKVNANPFRIREIIRDSLEREYHKGRVDAELRLDKVYAELRSIVNK